ncbi:MAG: hypothetical protein CFE24_08085 [Flavobacterium sp. BFFFF2]|nr:MAG: hypothetical protein CFE24_08085 [Flavobacterium sp. BFFFF2]
MDTFQLINSLNPDYAIDFVMKPTLTKSLHLQTPIKKSWFLMTFKKQKLTPLKWEKDKKAGSARTFFTADVAALH